MSDEECTLCGSTTRRIVFDEAGMKICDSCMTKGRGVE